MHWARQKISGRKKGKGSGSRAVLGRAELAVALKGDKEYIYKKGGAE